MDEMMGDFFFQYEMGGMNEIILMLSQLMSMSISSLKLFWFRLLQLLCCCKVCRKHFNYLVRCSTV